LFNFDQSCEFTNNVSKFRVGSLRESLPFWRDVLFANDFVLNVIEFGYLIPFYAQPSTARLNNNSSAFKHSSFVATAIESLLELQVIAECIGYVPWVVNPLTVSVNANGKERLILDLRHVNKYVEKRKFKFESVPEAIQYISGQGFMIKFDLRSGYHHVNIHPDHQKYLGFLWSFNGRPRYFVFRCLPFGLSVAGHVFSKVLRPLVKHWRSQAYRMVVYLDDGWGFSESFDACFNLSETVRKDLISAGLFINDEKSIWVPTQKLTWLGFVWDTKHLLLQIPDEKLSTFKDDVSNLHLNMSKLTPRKLAKITGKIISFMPSLGNICRIMTRNLLMIIATSNNWDDYITLTDPALVELDFWFYNCQFLPSRKFILPDRVPEKIIYTDASGFACAGYTVETNSKIVHKMWSESEIAKSSTYRELLAVLFTLQSLSSDLSGRLVKLFTDNQNVVRIIQAGSMKSDLQDLATHIFNVCISHIISLEVEWVPRNQNVTADMYSKIFDFDDWSVRNIYFVYFGKRWGLFDCDLFADYNNHKCKVFFSPYWCPGTSGVDAFSYDWSIYNCWIVPPVKLITKVVNHLKLCKGHGVLVVPKWTSSVFWPLLWSHEDNRFKYFVKDYIEYVRPYKFFEAGSDKNSIFAVDNLTFNVLVLKIDCRF